MKTLTLVLVTSLTLFLQSLGSEQDIVCTSSADTTSTLGTTGAQNLVILFVDFPEGRLFQNGQYLLPTIDSDTNSFPTDSQIDAVGGMGYILKNPLNPSEGYRKKIRKYTYDDYWDMYFSDYPTFTGTRSPDSASHNIICYGSFKDYFKEVSYNNLTFVPAQTKSSSGKYRTGIINPIDSVYTGGQWVKYVRWVMMPGSKASYFPTSGFYDILPVGDLLDSLYNTGQTTFNRVGYNGRICIVFAGGQVPGSYAGIAVPNENQICVREKRFRNYENNSTLDGIWVSVHECGHTLYFDHIPSSTYDPMTPTLRNFWSGHLYSPPHFNPLYKLRAGWISYNDFVKIKSDTNGLLLPSSKANHKFATVTLYGDAMRDNAINHSEYFVMEYRKREGFNRFAGGESPTAFQGGVLVWHYSRYTPFSVPDNLPSRIGLKVQNPDNFVSDPGDSSHLYYSGHNILNSSTIPNSYSRENLSTGISLSNFSVSGTEMNINVNYTLGAVPNWDFFIVGSTQIGNLFGNVYVEQTFNGSLVSNSVTIQDGTEISICPNGYFNALEINAVAANSIIFKGIGFGSNLSMWKGVSANFGSIQKCTIINAEIGLRFFRPLRRQTSILNNSFQNCNLSIQLDGLTSENWFPIIDQNFNSLEILNGTWEFTNPQYFIVPSNATFNITFNSTFAPTLKFASGAGIYSYGKLTANGSSTKNILFTSLSGSTPGSWGSIILNGSGTSGSNLNYVKMLYGTEIKAINVPSVVIQNSNIFNTINGINFYGSNGWIISDTIKNVRDHGIIAEGASTPACYHNTLFKNNAWSHYHTGAGILFSSGSHDYIWNNDIKGFEWGIGTIWGSSPELGHPSNAGINNRVTDCVYGLRIYQHSNPIVGYAGDYTYYGNSIYGNTAYAVSEFDYCSVYAQQAYWGGYPSSGLFSVASNSFLDYSDNLWYDPWSGVPTPNQSAFKQSSFAVNSSVKTNSNKNINVTSINSTPKTSRLFEGIAYRKQKKLKDAVKVFTEMIANNDESEAAVVELFNSCSDSVKVDVFDYFETISKERFPFASHLFSTLLVKRGETQEAKAVNEEIIKKYPNSDYEKHAKLQQMYISLYQENDFNFASSIVAELRNKVNAEEDIEMNLAQHALNTYVSIVDAKAFKRIKKGSLVVAQAPYHFSLEQNYPNPFNPSTIITYSIPEASNVSLIVYDMLGREVAKVVNEFKSTGNYTAQFNASGLASGMYIYRLTADNFTAEKKLVLLK